MYQLCHNRRAPDKFRVSAFSLSLLFRHFPDSLQNHSPNDHPQMLKFTFPLRSFQLVGVKDDKTHYMILKPIFERLKWNECCKILIRSIVFQFQVRGEKGEPNAYSKGSKC